ncbi:hypothetical protein [Mycobacterium sp. URHB0021]
MRELFAELRRVLADHGTLWLNPGDSYARNPTNGHHGHCEWLERSANGIRRQQDRQTGPTREELTSPTPMGAIIRGVRNDDTS